MAVVLNVNTITISGRIVKDPEYFESANKETGGTRCKFTVAVNRARFKADQPIKADFFYVVAWGKKAEVIAKYFHKGDPIYLWGEMQSSKYTKNGVPREGWEIDMEDFRFVTKEDKAQTPAEQMDEPGIGMEEYIDET